MSNILDVAQYICDYYYKMTNEPIDEMKLHKLLYFSQREKLALLNELLFTEDMQGWIHGPVSPYVRANFEGSEGIVVTTSDLSDEDKYIINNVLQQYGGLASWKLREISHQEISWQKSREGLGENEHGNRVLVIDDIREDAKKVKPFDSVWGMYYEDFDDEEGIA